MAKYDPLRNWLSSQTQKTVTVTFAQIEKIIGDRLPASARKYPVWWDNEEFSDDGHVQCKAWLEAGFRASRPDFIDKTVVFTKK